MAQIGQTTPTGGREWALHPGLCALREFTLATDFTLNHVGAWFREQTAANANNVVAGIYNSSGILAATSDVLSAAITSTVTFDEYEIPFNGELLTAGTYRILVIGNGANGNVVLQGQTSTAGLPTYANFDPEISFPTLPSDISALILSDASRAWDLYLDYTESAASDTPLTVDSGSLAVQGQTSIFDIGLRISIGSVLSLALEGTDVGLLADDSVVMAVEHRQMALEGQQIPFIYSNPGTEGQLALHAQDIVLSAVSILPIDVGSLAMAGQEVDLRFGGNVSLTLDQNSIAFAPSIVGLTATGQPETQENMVFDLMRPMTRDFTFDMTDISRGA